MPGANHRNSVPRVLAGGDIYPSRFVMVSTAADHTVLGCAAGSPPIGISQVGTKFPITNPTGQLGGGTITGPGVAAESGDQIQIFGQGDAGVYLECGGTVTRGDLLEAAGTTTNVGRAVTSGPGRNFGAVALESGTVGQLISVQIVIPAGGGAGVGSVSLTATPRTILATENGASFYLNKVDGITVTLPTATAGLKYKFYVGTAPTSVGYIITATPTDSLNGMMVERAGGAGVAGALTDVITFVANNAIIGDWVELESDGTTWFFHGMVDVAAGVTTTG